MLLLARVLLRDLQFDGFIGAAQSGEQRRRWFADLEINRPILDLNDRVVFEGAVEGMKIIVGGPRPIVFQVTPIQMVVVDEGAIEDDAAVRLQGCVITFAASAWVRPYADGPERPSESAFTTKPPKSGISRYI